MAYYNEDHLNKPLPPSFSASPAPMDDDTRQPTLPFRQDTMGSASQYSQRGNTLRSGSQYPPRSDTYNSAAGSQYPPRQDTYTSSVHSQPTAYGGAYDAPAPAPAASIYSDPPSYTGQQHLGTQQHLQNVSPISSTSANPFETPFDDTSASSRQNLAGAIPLQDRAGKDPMDDADHVYDAPKRPKKQGVRFGELGMFGAYANRVPWVVYIFTFVQISVFIGELADNWAKTGSPIEIHPSFNYLLGPSPYVLINFGARWTPCMHNVESITDATYTLTWPCPNTTSSDASAEVCTLSDLCGFGGVPEPKYDASASMDDKPEPNQWWRFILPMFMHAGIIHIGFNMLLQLTMGKEIERSIGSLRFFLVYVSAAIFGFVLGGNYASATSPSTGASGGLFGIIALNMLDLFYSWGDRVSPGRDLAFILLDMVISFVLGLLPGVDNFSHIGGLAMGIAIGLSILHSPNALRRRIGEDDAPYTTMNSAFSRDKPPGFVKNPVGFFKGRKPLWWAWWFIRAGFLLLAFIGFILLLNNFYVYHKTCSWCKYLSCLPVKNWCDSGFTFTNTTTSSKREVFEAAAEAVYNIPREFFA